MARSYAFRTWRRAPVRGELIKTLVIFSLGWMTQTATLRAEPSTVVVHSGISLTLPDTWRDSTNQIPRVAWRTETFKSKANLELRPAMAVSLKSDQNFHAFRPTIFVQTIEFKFRPGHLDLIKVLQGFVDSHVAEDRNVTVMIKPEIRMLMENTSAYAKLKIQSVLAARDRDVAQIEASAPRTMMVGRHWVIQLRDRFVAVDALADERDADVVNAQFEQILRSIKFQPNH